MADAYTRGNPEERAALKETVEEVSHLALDIGGYFSCCRSIF